MKRALVGRARSTRSATGEGSGFLGGGGGSFFAGGRGAESRVLLRSALRSTASPQTALRRTLDPSPLSVFPGAEHRPPGLGGGFCGSVGMSTRPAHAEGLWRAAGNDLPAQAHTEWDMGGRWE